MNTLKAVLFTINVPNSKYCYNKSKGIICPNFDILGFCTYEMHPEFDGKNFKKPKECLSLIWKENI